RVPAAATGTQRFSGGGDDPRYGPGAPEGSALGELDDAAVGVPVDPVHVVAVDGDAGRHGLTFGEDGRGAAGERQARPGARGRLGPVDVGVVDGDAVRVGARGQHRGRAAGARRADHAAGAVVAPVERAVAHAQADRAVLTAGDGVDLAV